MIERIKNATILDMLLVVAILILVAAVGFLALTTGRRLPPPVQFVQAGEIEPFCSADVPDNVTVFVAEGADENGVVQVYAGDTIEWQGGIINTAGEQVVRRRSLRQVEPPCLEVAEIRGEDIFDQPRAFAAEFTASETIPTDTQPGMYELVTSATANGSRPKMYVVYVEVLEPPDKPVKQPEAPVEETEPIPELIEEPAEEEVTSFQVSWCWGWLYLRQRAAPDIGSAVIGGIAPNDSWDANEIRTLESGDVWVQHGDGWVALNVQGVEYAELGACSDK